MDKQLAVAKWWVELAATTNDTFLPLMFDKHRFLVLMGGGGSGKSVFAARKVIERCTTEPGHNILVCRKVKTTIRKSCFALLRNLIAEYHPNQLQAVSKTDMTIRFRNGSQILFAGLDDPEKLKSIVGITSIWVEEATELEPVDLDQLNIRLRDATRYYRQILITFNPISITHWLKGRFFDAARPDTVTHRSSYRDNRFLDDEYRAVLESYRETDPYYYEVYALGQWGVLGKSIFAKGLLQKQLERIAGLQPEMGSFALKITGDAVEEVIWRQSREDVIRIYQRPKPGGRYVIGADTAGDGSDWFVAVVVDNRTGQVAAKLRQQFDEDEFAKQLYGLGAWYNDALMALEINYSIYPQKLLERFGYRRFYVREVMDDYTGRMQKAFGFKTTSTTRPVILAELVRIMREHPEWVEDRDILEEMLTFVRAAKTGRPEAEQGAHDDCVMATAIAYHARGQQETEADQAAEAKQWSEDMWTDYWNASEQERRILKEKWGEPIGG